MTKTVKDFKPEEAEEYVYCIIETLSDLDVDENEIKNMVLNKAEASEELYLRMLSKYKHDQEELLQKYEEMLRNSDGNQVIINRMLENSKDILKAMQREHTLNALSNN